MDSLSAFDEPQKLIHWAKEAIREGEAIRDRLITKDSFSIVREFEAATGDTLTKIVLKHPIPDDIGRKFTEALNNLRNSFDQSLFAACKAINKPIKDSHYPWADNPTTSLDGRLKGSGKAGKTIPVELWDTVRAQEPYATGPTHSGGNDLVRQIAKIANAKHTVGFRTGANVSGFVHAPVFISSIQPGGRFIIPMPRWDPVKNEIVVRRDRNAAYQSNDKHRIIFHISFDADPPVGALPAEQVLLAFAEHAQRVLDSFKARSRELIAH